MTEEVKVAEQEKPDNETQTTKKRSKWRWVYRVAVGLFIILLIPVVFLATGFGQRKTIEVVDQFLDQLSISNVEGSIQNGMTLKDAKFVMDGVDVSVGQVDLHIGFGCLFYRSVCLENFSVKDTKVVIDTNKFPPSEKKEEPNKPFTELNLPLEISTKNLSLDNIDVVVNEMEMKLEHFHAAMIGKGRKVTLKPTRLNGFNLLLAAPLTEEEQRVLLEQNTRELSNLAVKKAVQKTGEKVTQHFERLQGKEPNSAQETAENAKINWDMIREQFDKPVLDKNNRITLPLDFEIENIEITNVNISQKTKDEEGNFAEPFSFANIDLAQLQLKAENQKIELNTISVNSDQGNFNAQGELILSGDYPMNWVLEANEAKNAKIKLPVNQLKAEISGNLYEKTSLNVEASGPVNAKVNGDIALAVEKYPLNLNLISEKAIFPFEPQKGEDILKLEKIALNLTGDVTNYALNLSGNVNGMGIPACNLNLQGRGELTYFLVEALTLNALEGKTQLKGKVDWTEGVEWDAQTNLNGVNTKSLVPDWAGILNGGLRSKGYAGKGNNGSDWSVEVFDIDLKGSLLQKNLQLQGSVKTTPKQLLDIPSLNLIYGENKIAAKGILGDKSNFVADIKAPNLQGLVPKLKAGINGVVKLSGKIAEPNLDIDLVANNVAYDELKLQNLIAKGKVSTEKTIQGDITLAMKQFAFGDIKVENADIVASGSEANHTLKLTSKGNPVGANLNISGKFERNKEIWSGKISNVAINSTDFGTFKTDKVLDVNYNHKQIMTNVSAHCWNNSNIHFCFPQAFNAGQEGKIPFEIRNFDLKFVQQFLDKNSLISGTVNAKGEAAWFKNIPPKVNVELDSKTLKFVQKLDGGVSFPLTITPLKVSANMADNNLNVKTDLNIENNGRLTANLLMKDLMNSRTLSGDINIDKLTLKLIRPLLSAGEKIDGEINSRLTIGGSATSPLLHGKLELSNLKARANAMPFEVIAGGLSLNFNGASSTLNGKIKTNDSELHIDGDADWRNLNAWRTRVHAQANRFKVNIPNLAKVEVSPNIEVSATPTMLTLGGNIDIPWARIEVKELPESAISVSSDEVIMSGSSKNKVSSREQIPLPASNSMAVKSDIKINIGDDVRINAYGLNANLRGNIAVRQGKQGLGLYGQVNVYRGRFASFGQDLLIRKGRINFAGLPSQPMLDIEAIRNPEAMEDQTIVAGVRVTGLADNPEAKIFSEPSMSQNEAMSYLLTGRSLENSGDASSNSSMAAALLGMSLSKSSKTVGDIGSAFGLKDLSVTTAGIGDNTKIEASASLAPKFKVKYGVGIFAPLTELTLRYNLAPRLYLQWVSSINQAVDLMYRFTFD